MGRRVSGRVPLRMKQQVVESHLVAMTASGTIESLMRKAFFIYEVYCRNETPAACTIFTLLCFQSKEQGLPWTRIRIYL